MKKVHLIVLFNMIAIQLMAQTATVNSDAINLFLDCRYCDSEHIKNNMNYVNYVRDTKEADVHTLVLRENSGNGGKAYSYIFYGQNQFEGQIDTLKLYTQPDQTSDEVRNLHLRTLQAGLMPYMVHTDLWDQFDIKYNGETKVQEKKDEPQDKWNNWIFRTSINGWGDAESNRFKYELRTRLSAERITPKHKITARYTNYIYNKTVKLTEKTVVSEKRSNYFSGLYVKSFGPNWSAGGYINSGNSTYHNQKFEAGISPAIEYSFFPYSESTTKQLVARFTTGYQYKNYIDTTIFNKKEESLMKASLRFAFRTKQKWGDVNVSLTGNTYLHDLSKNQIYTRIAFNVRVVKGLSLRLSAGGSLIRDQLYLPKSGASSEQVLLQQQAVSTAYSYWANFGVNYTFGSIYNNVVNPRF